MEKVTNLFESIPRIEREQAATTVIGIAAAATLLYSSYCLFFNKYPKTKQGIKEIPMPGSAYPYVGHMMSLGELPGTTVAEWHEKLGPILKLKMGRQTWITVNDPALAHKIFVSHGAETSARPYSVFFHDHYSKGGKGVAFANGSDWRKGRTATLSILAPKYIDNYYMNSIAKEAQDLVSRLIASTEKESSADPFKFLELNSMNTIFSIAFGRRFGDVDDPEFRSLSELIEQAVKYAGLENDLANFLPIVSILDYFNGLDTRMKNFIKYELDPVILQLLQQALLTEGPNLAKSLDEDGHDMSETEKIAFMSDLIAAGTDTVSVTISWIIAIMCHHPEVQKKAAAEIDDFVARNGHLPTFKERNEVPYCISVTKECMRYRPTGPFSLPHATTEDIEVDGYFIPKGSTVIACNYGMHRLPEVYPKPEQFTPERFMNNIRTMQSAANGKPEDRDHYNFGWGRRICPGIYLADVEIFLAFVQLLSRCFIEPETDSGLPDLDAARNAGLTTLPLPYKVKFSRRVNELA